MFAFFSPPLSKELLYVFNYVCLALKRTIAAFIVNFEHLITPLACDSSCVPAVLWQQRLETIKRNTSSANSKHYISPSLLYCSSNTGCLCFCCLQQDESYKRLCSNQHTDSCTSLHMHCLIQQTAILGEMHVVEMVSKQNTENWNCGNNKKLHWKLARPATSSLPI